MLIRASPFPPWVYSNALFALGLLLLVPLTLGIIELAGRLFRCVSVDECPERGREKQGTESHQEIEEWAFRQRERDNKKRPATVAVEMIDTMKIGS